jgi:DNA-binding response OmpR family regulator
MPVTNSYRFLRSIAMECKGNVILIENDIRLNNSNSRDLMTLGYEVHQALTLRAAREYLAELEPDIILLDVMLPDGDGIKFCTEIRGITGAHIFFLTGKARLEEKLRSFAAGGDDYVIKHFHSKELLARVGAVMRRRNNSLAAEFYEVGRLKLNLAASQAYINDRDLQLTQKEFLILNFFVRYKNRYMTAGYIYGQIWGRPMIGSSNAIKVMISRLRMKLNGSGYTVVSKRGLGYCFEQED